MTREELHTEVATLTGEIVGMVSNLSPFDYKRKAEIDKEILALFDRYEREQCLVAAAIAHRACTGTEHDPLNGKLHGCCVVCGDPWPCTSAARFLPPGPEGGK